MTAKQRVKDLAAELGLGYKDILQHLREIGVQAKSQMSTISAEDVEQLKEALKPDGPKTEVVRREVQPGVIVRRRKQSKKPGKAEAAPAEEPSAEEATPVESPVEEAAEVTTEEAAEVVAEKAPEAEDKPQTEAAKSPAKKAAKKEEFKGARIVKPAPSEQPAPEAEKVEIPAEEPAVEAEAEAVEEPKPEAKKAAKTVEEEAKTEKAPEKTEAAPEKAEAKAKKPESKKEKAAKPEQADDKKKKKKKKRKEPEAPKVRIISMPDPEEVARREAQKAVEQMTPAGRRGPRNGAPGRGRPEQRNGARPAAPGTAPDPGQPDGRSRKKRKKDRRVVEFSNDGPRGREREFGGPGARGKKGKKGRRGAPQQVKHEVTAAPMKAAKRKIKFNEAIRLSDMAHQMGIKAQDLIKALFGMGVMATINQSLDLDTTTLLASEFGYEVENVSFDEQEFLIPTESDKPEELKPRPPVVTIMGHVDHGKTSLLDAIRQTNVTDGEAGGITQHIGAYHVKTGRGEVVFLDTPGHEAFTTMRMRGAQVTDIVILVVAADDGVMDQTREAIAHSKAAGVPIVVAVNKVDKEGANPDNVKRELAELGLIPEDWGGETIFAHVSAKMRTGLDELLEMVLLQAEVLELKANPDKPARGHIVEAKLDKGRGPVGTMLIAEGTIKQSDSFVCGVYHGKVRAMFNDQGKKIKKAGPAIPVEIQGFDGIPEAGDELIVVTDEKVARRIAQTRMQKQREKELAGKSKVTLESFLASKPDEEAQTLNLILKADVQGSLEAVTEALNKLSTDEVKINVVHGGAGAITESDILLAGASEAIIIGFNVRPNLKVKEIAEQENVEIRFYDIIYKLVNEVKDAMSGMLTPDIEEVYLGQAEVRDTFNVPKVGTVAGCAVLDGKITRNAKVRLLRGGVVTYTGELASLKRFKDDVKEVAKGYECGMGLEKFNDIKVGDTIEAFELKEVARTID